MLNFYVSLEKIFKKILTEMSEIMDGDCMISFVERYIFLNDCELLKMTR